jgi:predicted Zn finger-like uncharacterized protein
MILNCPSCDSRFRVRKEMFADGPRKVRCARCGHKWIGEPAALADEAVPVEAAQTPAQTDEIRPVEPVAELRAHRDDAPAPSEDEPPVSGLGEALDVPPLSDAAIAMDRPAGRRRTPAWVWIGWLFLFLLIAGTVAAFVFARGPMVGIWPPLERIYEQAENLFPEVAGAQVKIQVTESSLVERDGKNRMVLKLVIQNHSDREADLPLALIDLIDKDGKVFHTQPVRIPGPRLSAGEKRPDSITLDDVPSRLDRVSVDAVVDPGKDN